MKKSTAGVRESKLLKIGCSAAVQRLEEVADMVDRFQVVSVDGLVVRVVVDLGAWTRRWSLSLTSERANVASSPS